MISIKIKQVVRETADVLTLVFEPLVEGWHYLPGQFITLKLWVRGAYVYRSYSLCTTGYTDRYPAITIKRVEGGVVSNLLHRDIREGMILQALPPAGGFVLPPVGEGGGSLVLVAGGSGITPLFSMMKAALAQGGDRRVLVIYASRDEGSIIYRGALDGLVKVYGSRLSVVHVLSRPSGGWRGLRGRLVPSSFRALLAGVSDDVCTYYFLCAPRGLMDMVCNVLEGLGVGGGYIHREYFSLPVCKQSGAGFMYDLQVSYLGREYGGRFSSDKTLLEGALEAGADVPYACMSGRCNVCRGRCVEGEVVMDEDEGLTEEEIREGYVLTCVARPVTGKVRLLI